METPKPMVKPRCEVGRERRFLLRNGTVVVEQMQKGRWVVVECTGEVPLGRNAVRTG